MASVLNDLVQLSLTAAGTAEALTTGAEMGQSLVFTADSANTGAVYIGSSDVSSIRFALKLAPGESREMTGDAVSSGTADIELKEVYFDGDTTANLLNVGYFDRSNN